MKIKDGFLLKEIADNFVVIPTGGMVVDFNAMITLNESGVFLWRLLSEERTEEELVFAMLGEYDVPRAQAEQDVRQFVEKLRSEGLLEG